MTTPINRTSMNRPAANRPATSDGETAGGRVIYARKRDDLIAVSVKHRHESAVIIKDPIAMKYVRLRDDEYFVLCQLDGARSLEQITKRYAEKFAPRTAKPAQINELIFRLHEHGLLVSSPVGQGENLRRRAGKKRREKIAQAALSPLFIRFPGVDPDRFLNATIPFVRPLLHPLAIFCYALIASLAVITFAVNADQFVSETTDMGRWFRFESIVLLMVVIGATKVMHELGHAYVCKYFGGECHTIGPMLLLFSPALYCDTTDSWLLPNRFCRAAVGAAGMAVELVIASLATFVWSCSPDGLVHFAAMNVMLVCSISTLLFNANPLLRYDGYYILSDLCDVPNLGPRSQTLLSSTMSRLCLTGGPPDRSIANPGRSLMILYAVLAWSYRWMLTLTIVFLVSRMLRPIRLESVGVAMACFAAGAAIWTILRPVVAFVKHPLKRRRLEIRRVGLSAVAIGTLVAALTFPFPARVAAVATLTPKRSDAVFATVAGFVEMTATPGQRVRQGDVVAQLRNPAIELNYESTKGKLANQRALIEALEIAEISDTSVSERLPAARAKLMDLANQFGIHQARIEAMTIRAANSGLVIAGERKSASVNEEEQLSEWIDYATDEKNRGCFVASGTELFRIIESEVMQAELVVSQSVANRIANESSVRLALAAFPGDFQAGHVVDVSRRQMSQRRGDVDTTAAHSAIAATNQLLDVSYLVRVELQPTQSPVVAGQRGDALVATSPMSMIQRLYLVISAIFRMR